MKIQLKSLYGCGGKEKKTFLVGTENLLSSPNTVVRFNWLRMESCEHSEEPSGFIKGKNF
jgi:hypothetical protein